MTAVLKAEAFTPLLLMQDTASSKHWKSANTACLLASKEKQRLCLCQCFPIDWFIQFESVCCADPLDSKAVLVSALRPQGCRIHHCHQPMEGQDR